MIDLNSYGSQFVSALKRNKYLMPYKTGNLRNSVSGIARSPDLFEIEYDGTQAPYIQYLEEGTDSHNIPRAFGRKLPFGTKGRFNGKFHPGSLRWRGFISSKTIEILIHDICTKYGGVEL